MRLTDSIEKAKGRWRFGQKRLGVRPDEVTRRWRTQVFTEMRSWDGGRELGNQVLGFAPGDVLDNDAIAVRVEVRIVSVGRARRVRS